MNRCTVITGPPGSGKTPLVEHLIGLGFDGVPEPARAVIAKHPAVGGRGIYDRDPQLFIDLMLSRSLQWAASHAASEQRVFFDRALPDLIGYAELFGLDPTRARVAADQYRYEDVVFVLPAWPEIYVTDSDRRMTFEDAARFGEEVCGIYRDLGYTLVEVPRTSVADRATFIVRKVGDLPEGLRDPTAVQLGAAPDESSP